MLSTDGTLDNLPGRLLLNHFRGRQTRGLEEAAELLASADPPIHAVAVSMDFDFARDGRALAALREKARSDRLQLVAVGDEPSAGQRSAMRRAGVDFLLVEPATDTELRFLMNQAVWDTSKGNARSETRVPTNLVARVHSPAGMKVASVYNLSTTGAYLETPRPTQERNRVEVELPLPSGGLRLPALVVGTNVTGNLRRQNLPRGMSVRFDNPSRGDASALAHFVDARVSSFKP